MSRWRWLSASIAAIGVSLLLAVWSLGPASADVTIGGGPFNCDANAVIFCGASSASQLVSRYNNGDGHNSAASIHNIYSWFGISSAEIQSTPTTAVVGSVTKSGAVLIGSKTVATGAITGGRQNIAGSTVHNVGGTIFYSRPPSVSFENASLPAYVVMINGRFAFAVIASCGNAVMATPVAPPPTPAPTPKPTPPPTPTPTPTPPAVTATCDLFKVMANSDRTVTVTALNFTAKNVSFTSAVINWGDNSSTQPITDTSQFTNQSHQYANFGTYIITAVVNFSNGASAGGQPPCEQQVQFVNNQTPPVIITTSAVTPTPSSSPPTSLVNTGPGSVVGLFTGATVAGTLGYRWYLGRRLSR